MDAQNTNISLLTFQVVVNIISWETDEKLIFQYINLN